jgi:glycosyltransferase involved in cell wall biosynthesis
VSDNTTEPTGSSVSVVIPSLGRRELPLAVASALAQTHPPLEFIVVFDLDEVPDAALVPHPRVRSLTSGGGLGGNGARAIGARTARGTHIAFLDDDDLWAPTKLERQLAAHAEGRARGVELIVATAAQVVDGTGRRIAILPRRPPARGESVADYVLRRRSLMYGESMLCSSMLLFSHALLDVVPLDTSLRLHEDWEWLMRATRQPRVELHMLPEALLVYRRNATGTSTSSSGRWELSVAWLDRSRGLMSRRAYADGLLTVTVPMAINARDRRTACKLIARALRRGPPGVPALLFAALMLAVPNDRLAAIARAVGRLRGAY